jgi:NAD(P)-dependent dehydrogenase (short-subunit alcohol dehydrogenase family)
VLLEPLAETKKACEQAAPPGTRVSIHACDVSNEAQVLSFRDAVLREHATDRVDLLFNNAGVGGGGSFLLDSREEWERTFGVCWFGVYYCTRAFLPLLIAAPEAYLVNTSSVNGFWACLGPGIPHTAYSTAKFAVKGFTEALLTDLRVNAPHVKAAVVMPGHVGTSIALNSLLLHGKPLPADMPADAVAEMRARMVRDGLPVGGASDDDLRAAIQQRLESFESDAPTTAAQAAAVILQGVRDEQWRILVGEDAFGLDRLVRERPEEAYEPSFTGLGSIGAAGARPPG